MAKRKIKKSVKNFFSVIIIVLFLFIGVYSGINIYKQKQYEKTYEYKLLQLGYSSKDVKLLIDKYKQKEIDYILTKESNNIYIDILNDKYFIYDNFYNYLKYLENNLDKPIRNIIEKVNTFTSEEYYLNILDSDTSKNNLLIVNKYYKLETDYAPNLVTIPTTYSWGEYGSKKATEDTYNAFLDMWNGAKENGYYLMVSSSYRDYNKQEEVYNEYQKDGGTEYADSYAARPGHSEHQTGYALDIFEKNATRQETFHETEVFNWLKDNSYKYGFILRYPQDKEEITGYSFESWHYRYVGKDVAKYIFENNITFDEYYAYFINK